MLPVERFWTRAEVDVQGRLAMLERISRLMLAWPNPVSPQPALILQGTPHLRDNFGAASKGNLGSVFVIMLQRNYGEDGS